MNRNLACFGVLLYLLVSILNKHKCMAIKCYDCDNCPKVSNASISTEECARCIVGGVGSNTYRRCLYKGQSIPADFPEEGQQVCYTDLCNGKTTSPPEPPIKNPIKCYVCEDCGKSKGEITYPCGGCAIWRRKGKVSRLCGPNCNEAPGDPNLTCCTTDLCNGMTNVIANKNIIIFLLLITLMRAYTM
ncbi:unnamed protein product [Trichobilharzia szidati]|nr:unnamed protein product [Trichobilharzia szidati]